MRRVTHTLRANVISHSNSFSKVVDTIRKKFGERSIAENMSLSTQPPVFSTSKRNLVSKPMEVYQHITVDPLHTLHFGISKLLKVVMSERLCSTTLTTPTIRSVSYAPKLFPTVFGKVLETVNLFLHHAQGDSGLQVQFSTTSVGKTCNGLFRATGITGMLAAKNLSTIDCVLPFISATVDRGCEEEAEGPVTDVFSRYFEIVRTSYQRDVHVG